MGSARESVLAVYLARAGRVRVDQRPVRAGRHRHVLAAVERQHAQGVAGRRREPDVAEHGGHAEQVHVRAGAGERDGEGVVHARVGVDEQGGHVRDGSARRRFQDCPAPAPRSTAATTAAGSRNASAPATSGSATAAALSGQPLRTRPKSVTTSRNTDTPAHSSHAVDPGRCPAGSAATAPSPAAITVTALITRKWAGSTTAGGYGCGSANANRTFNAHSTTSSAKPDATASSSSQPTPPPGAHTSMSAHAPTSWSMPSPSTMITNSPSRSPRWAESTWASRNVGIARPAGRARRERSTRPASRSLSWRSASAPSPRPDSTLNHIVMPRPTSHRVSLTHGWSAQNEMIHGSSPAFWEAADQDIRIWPEPRNAPLPMTAVTTYAPANRFARSVSTCGTPAAITAMPAMPRNTERTRTLSATTFE